MTRHQSPPQPLHAAKVRAGFPPPSRPDAYPGLDGWQYPIGTQINHVRIGRPGETPVPPAEDPKRARLVEEIIERVKEKYDRRRMQ